MRSLPGRSSRRCRRGVVRCHWGGMEPTKSLCSSCLREAENREDHKWGEAIMMFCAAGSLHTGRRQRMARVGPCHSPHTVMQGEALATTRYTARPAAANSNTSEVDPEDILHSSSRGYSGRLPSSHDVHLGHGPWATLHPPLRRQRALQPCVIEAQGFEGGKGAVHAPLRRQGACGNGTGGRVRRWVSMPCGWGVAGYGAGRSGMTA